MLTAAMAAGMTVPAQADENRKEVSALMLNREEAGGGEVFLTASPSDAADEQMKQKLLPERGEAETGKNQEEREDASPSDAEKDTEKEEETGKEGEEESDLKEEETAGPETMPEIGSLDFDKWFEENCEEEALWQQILDILKNSKGEEQERQRDQLLLWISEHEEMFRKACSEFFGQEFSPSLLSLATGDLWDEWIGADMDWEGLGTKENPFMIRDLSGLMGLSEAVARGNSFSGVYFELQEDIHIENLELNGGSWNPIGWFRSRTELGGKPGTAFMGNFDGAGHTITGLKFAKPGQEYSYLGLFGRIEDAQIRNLNLEAEEISGGDNVAVLTGCAEGQSVICNVSVSGSIYAGGDAGGIAGEVTGKTKRAVLENCRADNVIINSEGRNSFVGGIAGNVQKAVIADSEAVTLDGDSSRIQGKGYVGGIAGRQNDTDIYNVCTAGTIGGSGSRAAGGMTGLYESGNLIGARFEGDIGRTGNGAASHEGTFIGTRDPKNGFRYGTGRQDNVAFLFAGTPAQAKHVIGSSIADDNSWTMDAHIGYFTDYQRRYCLVAGTREEDGKDRFFYEELEDAVQHIITQKLGESLDEFWKDRAFNLDHYAPGNSGEPVRGYLVSIPRIDARNANGTYDSDVAVMTAISSTNNSYYRQIDKEHPSAVAPGCTVTVATAAKNQAGNMNYTK